MTDDARPNTPPPVTMPAGLEPGLYPFTRLVGDSPTRFQGIVYSKTWIQQLMRSVRNHSRNGRT